jgi:hypothetical protein
MLTNNQKIQNIVTGLEVYDFGDIIKSRNQNMMIATFILCTFFIDHLSQHRYYKQKLKVEKFIEFTNEYLDPQYEAEVLYKDLRSKLVHNYSVNGKFLLADEFPERHFAKENERIYLNIDRFINDLNLALKKYIKQLNTDENIRKIAIEHYNKYSILVQK